MVTQMIQAMTLDVLQAVKQSDLFSLDQNGRNKAMKDHLPDYPTAVTKYLASTDEEQFVADMEGLLPVLGSESVIAQAQQLRKEENVFFNTVLKSLSACRSMTGDATGLAKQIAWFKEASGMYQRVFDRELQLLLLTATGEDSPIAQIATDAEVDLSHLPGVPSVQVQRSLLGGSRVFHNGTLNDQSWRARLTKILSAVS